MKKLRLKIRWEKFRKSAGFHNLMLYLLFVVIATLFWFVVSLNDSVQETLNVKVNIYNIPDSVTFINDPPAQLTVTVRDKGTSLMRSGILKDPSVNIDFKEYATGGVFRLQSAELYSALRQTFGPNASIGSVSRDSLLLAYTTNPGKRVPVVVSADLTAASGSVIAGKLQLSQRDVLVFSSRDVLDTLTRVFTERIVRKNLSETTEVEARLLPIPHSKISPAAIKVKIPVEALVNRRGVSDIRVDNIPHGHSLILFPAKAELEYYIPMSRYNDDNFSVVVAVDYNDIRPGSKKIPVRIIDYPNFIVNPSLLTDSVEYTIVN